MATTVATLGASVAAVAALWFSGQSLKVSNNQQSQSQQTAVTDRFRLAAEQLASDQVTVRVSGIYLFERLAKDSPADHPTILALLGTFIRAHAGNEKCRADAATDPRSAALATPVDLRTALTVIARRDTVNDDPVEDLDLHQACLPRATLSLSDDRPAASFAGADLSNAVLSRSDLTRADLAEADLSFALLTGADLAYSNLTGVGLRYAQLPGARLAEANLAGAHLLGANLADAILSEANLTGADFFGANLTNAVLTEANLTGANLEDANLTGARLHADLTGADLTNADLTGANLTGANLTGVVYNFQTRWPDGFTPP
ncbi:pentapeptide repeat-containing protein [Nocardia gipuzkoensis]|uniref:pentapeptide repeat-containing protein n=1 Tax=Nocardia gipuzkoensis TaxID=2749991 RepID=UPI0015EFA7FD|nr:pentapeptide repeat-containing protein [Nocardia gipuzkoensis]